jgi:hypothetical protein
LLNERVRVELVFSPTLDGEKVSLTPGAMGAVTLRVAVTAAVLSPAGAVDSAPELMVSV